MNDIEQSFQKKYYDKAANLCEEVLDVIRHDKVKYALELPYFHLKRMECQAMQSLDQLTYLNREQYSDIQIDWEKNCYFSLKYPDCINEPEIDLSYDLSWNKKQVESIMLQREQTKFNQLYQHIFRSYCQIWCTTLGGLPV